MRRYKLKASAPEFTAVDGPLAGRRFEHGATYDEVPAGDAGRFEPVQQAVDDAEADAPASKTGRKSGKG
ncbi:hypothetical protein [Desulfovibrio aminophilus]|uniref:hypothetical protein n=1 Tax=Desulfovibrio aminophilus TaxID=81425 RepID=UPI0004104E0E|nr:hypothetical protein [Desulfovibrio aminophilus]